MLFLPAQKFRDVSIRRTRGGDRLCARRQYRSWWPDYWFTPFESPLTSILSLHGFIPMSKAPGWEAGACGPPSRHFVYQYVGNIWAHSATN
jgi:hypothetical protein